MRRNKQENNVVQKCNIPVKPERRLSPIYIVLAVLVCLAIALVVILLLPDNAPAPTPAVTTAATIVTPPITTAPPAITTAATTTAPPVTTAPINADAPVTTTPPVTTAPPISDTPAPSPGQGLSFTSNGDGTCYVSGIGSCTDTDIVIPSVSVVAPIPIS